MSPSAESPSQNGFPMDLETLLSNTAQLLMVQRSAREVAILSQAEVEPIYAEYDNWNGGTDVWCLRLSIPLHLYTQFADDDRKKAGDVICRAASEFFRFDNEYIRDVNIVLRMEKVDQHWRAKAAAHLRGEGLTNQGRVRSDNPAPLQVDGLLFRSQPEVHLYRALKSSGVPFMPLPVVIRGGDEYGRLEPDFIIIRRGMVFHIEVDGSTVHFEPPVVAHQRTAFLSQEGVVVERISASDCMTYESAKECSKKLLAVLDKHLQNRR